MAWRSVKKHRDNFTYVPDMLSNACAHVFFAGGGRCGSQVAIRCSIVGTNVTNIESSATVWYKCDVVFLSRGVKETERNAVSVWAPDKTFDKCGTRPLSRFGIFSYYYGTLYIYIYICEITNHASKNKAAPSHPTCN